MLIHDVHQFNTGDGDSRHIGFKVPMPDAYEISSVSIHILAFSFSCLIHLSGKAMLTAQF